MIVVLNNYHKIRYVKADEVTIDDHEVNISRDNGEYYNYKFREYEEHIERNYIVFYCVKL